jgi:hypothetical protein
MEEDHTMKHKLRLTAFLTALALAAHGSLALAQTTSFTDTYKGGSNSSCGFNYGIDGKEPSAAGTYPVFVHLVGTSEGYLGAHALAARDASSIRTRSSAAARRSARGPSASSTRTAPSARSRSCAGARKRIAARASC